MLDAIHDAVRLDNGHNDVFGGDLNDTVSEILANAHLKWMFAEMGEDSG
jgi:hypothetical protein